MTGYITQSEAKVPSLILKFEGGDADQHLIGMGSLGQALIGIDRIATAGIIAIDHRHMPRNRERSQLIVKARQPVSGSLEIWADVKAALGELPLAGQILRQSGGEFVVHFLSYVLKSFGGRKKDAPQNMDAILQMFQSTLSHVERSEIRQFEDQAKVRELLINVASGLKKPAIAAVAPIGRTVSSLTICAGELTAATVDEPMADAIRDKGDLEIGDLQTMALVTDGWVYHNQTLSIHHPDVPGKFIAAKVKDPLAEFGPNPYADAASMKRTIQVRAKPAYRDGMLETIYILDYIKT
ncbi:hypothetical protein ACELLULO517_27425 [Acidisoma cellulosilytica]|uniref:Uncharacterized protein n=1 Tax=Acidisoma cellulosilyticum TaxID=2802395 RepID=A0A963Z6X9_9PROT|nr:hypothetical protein [Acidisoma cellulosilyticum]MCB8883999.1 hypothetical protein [Acidisoma cellulosilyticum]